MRRALPFLALFALILLFFWKLASTNLILARGDVLLYFYPYWDYRAEVLRTGHVPLWNPFLFMGAPFLANSQTGVLYPPNWPLIWLSAPAAVKASTLLHLGIAASGALLFARRALALSRPAAFLSAVVFALGGYFTAQVEHVNQFQGLAWFPLLLYLTDRAADRIGNSPTAPPSANSLGQPSKGRLKLRNLALISLVVALQLFAGHTQSAFISLAGATAYSLWRGAFASNRLKSPALPGGSKPRHLSSNTIAARLRVIASGFWNLGFGIWLATLPLAALLAAAQLVPTQELWEQSLRSAGLNLRIALSFSLHPLLVGRALLPGYSRSLFSEFIAYIGVSGLVLAVLGASGSRGHPRRLAMLVLAGLGLFLALGSFNPLYYALANFPPLDLFRAPARWLFLLCFGAAMLAGCGLDLLRLERPSRKQVTLALGLPGLLMLLTLGSAGIIPPGELGPLPSPTWQDWLGWLLPLAIAALMLIQLPPIGHPSSGPSSFSSPASLNSFLSLVILELFAASRPLPYNHPTSPEAFFSIRPASTEFLAAAADTIPPGRVLSMSGLEFDPGDLAELESAWDSQLPEDEVIAAIVATKHNEVLSPNLSLVWRIPSVQGYDGGILPLRNFADFVRLLIPGRRPASDGLFRENLTEVPPSHLMNLTNTQFLIADKLQDAWIDGVFYDLQFPQTLVPGNRIAFDHLPRFQATTLNLMLGSRPPASLEPSGGTMDRPDNYGYAQLVTSDGSHYSLPILLDQTQLGIAKVQFGQPLVIEELTLLAAEEPLTIRGASLVDRRSGAFQGLTLGPFRLLHSGDVKIYENLQVLPRAFGVGQTVIIPDQTTALARLGMPDFDPARTAVLYSGLPNDAQQFEATVEIVASEPERVAIQARFPPSGGYLVLTDAYYPGWRATVDGAPEPIQRADLMFRAVLVPPGEHTIEFTYSPASWRLGLALSTLGILLWTVILFVRPAEAK